MKTTKQIWKVEGVFPLADLVVACDDHTALEVKARYPWAKTVRLVTAAWLKAAEENGEAKEFYEWLLEQPCDLCERKERR